MKVARGSASSNAEASKLTWDARLAPFLAVAALIGGLLTRLS
jgi:hypothetical protein